MLCKVDWLSFTIPTPSTFGTYSPETLPYIHEVTDAFLGGIWKPVFGGHGWQVDNGRGFYRYAITDDESKIVMSIGDINNHIYFQCGGQACDYMRSLSIYEQVVEKVSMRCSRIDFAVDFKCDVKPQDFIVNYQAASFKSGGRVHSPDGETCYVGSRKGERFARVYRYHPPHPRSENLRVEVEAKGEWAKILCKLCADEGDLTACLAAHAVFGWSHPLWQPNQAVQSLRGAKAYDTGSGSGLRWLNSTVAASLVRAHKEKVIDARSWFASHVLDKL